MKECKLLLSFFICYKCLYIIEYKLKRNLFPPISIFAAEQMLPSHYLEKVSAQYLGVTVGHVVPCSCQVDKKNYDKWVVQVTPL